MPNLSDSLIDDANVEVIDLMRVAAHLQQPILAMLQGLESELAGKITSSAGRRGLNAGSLRSLLRAVQGTISTMYGKAHKSLTTGLSGVAKASGQRVRNIANSEIGVELITSKLTTEQLVTLASETYIGGGYAKEWWGRQAAGLLHNFQMQMRLGVLQGESVPDLIKRLRGSRAMGYKDGVMELPRNQAEALVRTSVIAVGNAARLQSYINNRNVIKGVVHVATLDGRTTFQCISRDGLSWELPESGDSPADFTPIGHDKIFINPPLHFNCRSTLISLLKSFAELAGPNARKPRSIVKDIDTQTRASMDGQIGVAQGYEGWLNSKDAAFQDDLLGPTVGKLWRQGKIGLTELTNQNNRPLTVVQLLEKAAGRLGRIVPPKKAG